MATLVLEELNLVTLNELLQRLPHNTLVGELTAIINERELFTPEQATAIVDHFNGNRPAVSNCAVDVDTLRERIRRLMWEHCGSFIGDLDIPLIKYLPMHVNRTHQLRLSQYPDDNTTVNVYNPTIGKAFWPSVNEVIAWVIEGGNDNVVALCTAVHMAALKKADESRRP